MKKSRNLTNKELYIFSSFSLFYCTLNVEMQTKQENLQAFLEKRERGELLVQKTARLCEKFLAPAQLSSSTSTYVSFDQAIQLIASDMPKIYSVGSPMTLSVVVNEPNINSCQEIDQHCVLSCAYSPTKPTARNTFIIRRPFIRKHRHRRCNSSTDDTMVNIESDSQYLKYGQDFMLECYDSKQKPLMLYSSPQSPFGGAATSASSAQYDYVFKVHGEMKQSVGLALLKERNFNDQHSKLFYDDDTTIPSNFFHWKMFHINPEIRYETIGANIPVCLFSLILYRQRQFISKVKEFLFAHWFDYKIQQRH
jgi:hypothetical protein